jgi:hypothetical protein
MINRSNEDLPRKGSDRLPIPSSEQQIAGPVAHAWWEQYQAGPDFRRARAIEELPLRASAVALRCDRAFWYSLVGTTPTNATDAAGVFRMRLGTLVHDELASVGVLTGDVDDKNLKQGWFEEEAIDLSSIMPGSAHGDWIHYLDGKPTEVAEIKTVGGYAFKLMASNFNGPPEGPKWEHAMQAALVAVAIGAQKIRLVYFAMENLAPSLAEAVAADEFGRFCAEWVFDMDEPFPGASKTLREAVHVEAKREIRLLALATPTEDGIIMPERVLSHPDYPGGSMVIDPKPAKGKAKWVKYNIDGEVVETGTTWMCEYCDWLDQCVSDGGASVTISKKVDA